MNNKKDPPHIHPWDSHNQELAALVRPRDWQNPLPASSYNLVVIGAGTAGLVCAAGAAGLGAKVALIEQNFLGGDCLNAGCVPSKALVSAARVAALVRGAGEYGVSVPDGLSVDFVKVMERMRKLRASIASNDSAGRFRNLGIDVFFGSGRFIDSRTIAVKDAKLHFKKAVIATGARASAPPMAGLDHVAYLTNETLFSLTELPRRLAVVGAGPIGCEMAQAFARFGSQVVLVETVHGILPREDSDASALVLRSLRRDGVKLICCAKDLKLSGAEDGGARLIVASHGKNYDFTADRLLVAAGRAPNVEDLGLEAAGVLYSKKGVQVNDHLQTTTSEIYAAGDVCSPFQFTHAADFMARIVIRNALFSARARASALTIPWCTYTEPEIAHIGLYEKQAKEQGIKIDTFTCELKDIDRSVLEGRASGLVRVLVRRGSDRIIGATVVASNAGDMISEISLAMTNGLGLKQIAGTIHPYPTQAEAIRQVADAYNRTRLTPLVRKLFSRWFAWQR